MVLLCGSAQILVNRRIQIVGSWVEQRILMFMWSRVPVLRLLASDVGLELGRRQTAPKLAQGLSTFLVDPQDMHAT